MKFSGALALALLSVAGCGVVERPAPAPVSAARSEGREYIERLRVDTVWHPVAMGAECVGCWYELAPNAYIAQGWPWYAGYCGRPWGGSRGCARPSYWGGGCVPIRACY